MSFMFGLELTLNIAIGLDLLLTLTNAFDRAKNLNRIKCWTYVMQLYVLASVVIVALVANHRLMNEDNDEETLEEIYPSKYGLKVNIAS